MTVLDLLLQDVRFLRVYDHWFATHIKTHAQVVTDLQTSCNKVVVKPILLCVRTACSQLLKVWNKLLSPGYKVDDDNY